MRLKNILNSFVCVVTAGIVFTTFTITASATSSGVYERDAIKWFLSQHDTCQQGILHPPAFYQNLDNYSNYSDDWDTFATLSYENILYYTIVYTQGNSELYIIKYDNITNIDYGASRIDITFDSFSMFQFVQSSDTDTWLSHCNTKFNQTNSSSRIYLGSNYFDSGYIQFSLEGKAIYYDADDTQLLTESIDENKDKGIASGLKNLVTGKGINLTGVDASLVDFYTDSLLDLGVSFGDWLSPTLSADLGFDVSVGDDTYNEIVADLTNNTSNSSYWANISADTTQSIKNTYNNMKQCVDNSVKVYNNDAGDYYYQPVTTVSSNDSYPNYNNYISNGGTTTSYFNDYVKNIVNNNTTNTGGSDSSNSNSSSGGAYAEANAQGGAGGNASIGDIVINVPDSSSGSNSDSESGEVESVNLDTFSSLIDSVSDFWVLLQNMFAVFPAIVWGCLASGVTVVVICRILGR